MRWTGRKLRLTGFGLARLVMAAGFGFVLSAGAHSPDVMAAVNKKGRLKIKTPPKGSRLHVVTDKLTYNGKTKIAVATGKVVITYGKYVLVATKVVYDKANDRMRAVALEPIL